MTGQEPIRLCASNRWFSIRFSYLHLIIFEKFILRLKDVDQRYSNKEIKKSEILYKKMTSKQISNLKLAIMGGLPASEKNTQLKISKK